MPVPSIDSVDNLWLGILLDPHQATVVHDLGPHGGSAEVIIVIIISITTSFFITLTWMFILKNYYV